MSDQTLRLQGTPQTDRQTDRQTDNGAHQCQPLSHYWQCVRVADIVVIYVLCVDMLHYIIIMKGDEKKNVLIKQPFYLFYAYQSKQ